MTSSIGMKQTGKTHRQSRTNTFSKKGPIKFHLVLLVLLIN